MGHASRRPQRARRRRHGRLSVGDDLSAGRAIERVRRDASPGELSMRARAGGKMTVVRSGLLIVIVAVVGLVHSTLLAESLRKVLASPLVDEGSDPDGC